MSNDKNIAQPDAIGVTGGEVASVHLDGGGRPTLEAQTLRDIANAYFGDERDIECCLVAMRRAMELVALGLEAAARKSGDMAQGEQQWKYVVDALIAGDFVSQEKVDQAIAIYSTVAHPAASTGAGQISTEEKYRWVTEQAIYQQEGSYGWYEVTIDAPLQEDIDVTPEKFDAMVCAQIAAAQPKGDG